MSLYYEAVKFLDINPKKGSLQSRIFGSELKSDPKQMFALVSSTLKYKTYLTKIIKNSDLLKNERMLKPNMALLLVHDLLFTKSKRINMGKTPLKEAVLRHKTRLNGEFIKLKLKYKVRSFDELIEIDGPPIRWFRINTIKITVDKAMEDLNKQFTKIDKINDFSKGIPLGKIYHDKHIPNLFGINPNESITKTTLYKRGEIIIQDRASCFPAHILNPKSGDKVIDACAAPGNKTTHLAAHVNNTPSSVFAFEKDKARSDILKMMSKKAGASKCIEVTVGDFTQSNPDDYNEVVGLVVDPSCSGSGIFGRAYEEQDESKAETYSKERLAKLAGFQFSIMKHALSFPAAEKVVYSTCSISAEENEQVVRRLLEDQMIQGLGWRLSEKENVIPSWHRRGFVKEFKGLDNDAKLAAGCIRALPKVDGGIGFFAAAFERDAPEIIDDVMN